MLVLEHLLLLFTLLMPPSSNPSFQTDVTVYSLGTCFHKYCFIDFVYLSMKYFFKFGTCLLSTV
jgi:hypothetical protein